MDDGTTTAPRASLILLQFLAWIAARDRDYAEAMDAWRTSCPRLSVWEDAIDDGLVELRAANGRPQAHAEVRLTPRGAALLAAAAPSRNRAAPGG